MFLDFLAFIFFPVSLPCFLMCYRKWREAPLNICVRATTIVISKKKIVNDSVGQIFYLKVIQKSYVHMGTKREREC